MGQTSSTPGDSTKHVFSSDTPIQFSQELIDSLQASSETNSSRAKTLDLHIAQRVHEELEKIQTRESSRLDEVRKKIASESSGDTSSKNSSDQTKNQQQESTKSKLQSLLEIPSVSPKDLLRSSGESDEEKARKDQSSKKVQDEIAKLKKALGERKVLREIPEDVDKARGEVISCLRLKDRQPLDCWKEVEIFKREVRKMEERYVGSLL